MAGAERGVKWGCCLCINSDIFVLLFRCGASESRFLCVTHGQNDNIPSIIMITGNETAIAELDERSQNGWLRMSKKVYRFSLYFSIKS